MNKINIYSEVFKKSTTENFTVLKLYDKQKRNKIMDIMKEEIRKIAKGCKMSLIEGTRIIERKPSSQ